MQIRDKSLLFWFSFNSRKSTQLYSILHAQEFTGNEAQRNGDSGAYVSFTKKRGVGLKGSMNYGEVARKYTGLLMENKDFFFFCF